MTDIYQTDDGERALGIIGPVQVTAADNQTVGRLYYQEPFWLVNWGRAWWSERISPDYAHALNQRALRKWLLRKGAYVVPAFEGFGRQVEGYECRRRIGGGATSWICTGKTEDEVYIAAVLAVHEKQKGISDEQ